MITPCSLFRAALEPGSFPPPALPGICGNTSPSATLPARPAPHRGSGWCVRTTDRASRVATVSLFHACRRHYPGGTCRCSRRSLPGRWQPSPSEGAGRLRIARFGACSAFTRVAARMVAEPPKAASLHRSASGHVVPTPPAPIATGWSDSCRAGFAPARRRRLSTAHRPTNLTSTGTRATGSTARSGTGS